MKTTARRIACFLAPVALVLTIGCKSKPIEATPPPPPPPPVSQNVFLGNWVGQDRSGATYNIRFTNDLQWESHIEEGGASRPHYKGTYAPEGSRVRFTITEEANLATMGWRPERGNVPTTITGNISGGTLKVGSILTDADLRRREPTPEP
ncbi:MAG: hypothetical protein FWG12_00290 [Holophagaceae bacterium]|nr:hypothetical protein [Holophagaceae bacterium]